jgi:hypothetical protein
MTDGEGLAAALSKFQGEMTAVAKTKTANIRSDKGNYSYQYADLGDVVAAAYPILSKHGLAFMAKPMLNAEGHLVLAYKLLHESGDAEGGEYPLPPNGTPQQMGSAITYARRYTFCAVTGVVSEEDDDGKAAPQEREPTSRPRKAAATQDDTITEAQLKKLHVMISKTGWKREEGLRFYDQTIHREVESSKDLTKREAMKVIDALQELERGGRLVPEGINPDTGEVADPWTPGEPPQDSEDMR